LIGSVGDSYDNALAEAVNALYKTELIRGPGQGPCRTIDDVERVVHLIQRSDIADRLAAISDHHRRVHQHPTPVMTPIQHLRRRHRLRQRRSQPRVVSQISQQPRPRINSQTPPPASKSQPRPTTTLLHHASALPDVVPEPSYKSDSATPGGQLARTPTPTQTPLLKNLR